MTTADALQALVEQRYATLDVPSWDDPHGTSGPPDEAYSRVTDPDRYRIVHVRARVWAEVLAERLGVQVEPLEPFLDPEQPSRVVVGGYRLLPPAPGARPMLLAEIEVRDEDEPPLPVLDVVLDRPGFTVGSHPHCGCDACDAGSDDELRGIDRSVMEVLTGPYAMLRGDGWTATRGGGHASAGGLVDLDHKITLAERVAGGEVVVLPAGTEVVVSRSWLA